MAYNALNNLIDAYIYANGVQAITGQILNGVLKQMVAQLGSGYHLMGVAVPATAPEQNDFAMAYFAATAGEYADFGGITLAPGEVAVFLTSGNGAWTKQTIYTVPTGTADLDNTAGFITKTVADLANYYTKTEIDTTLADYPTRAALATALADYYTKTEIDAILDCYTTNTALASALADYYNKNDIDGLLSVVNTALADRYTKQETDSKFNDYYRKAETYDKDEVDSIVAALSRQEYIVAWDGTTAPDVSTIPAGVTVTYSGTPYTGTMDASASTMNKIYMVWNGTAYDMYGTSQDGGYSWVPMGTTTVDLSQYATKAEVSQLEAKVDYNIEGNLIFGKAIETTGVEVTDSAFLCTDKIPSSSGDNISWLCGAATNYSFAAYNSSNTKLDFWRGGTSVRDLTMPNGTAYIRASFKKGVEYSLTRNGQSLIYLGLKNEISDRCGFLSGEFNLLSLVNCEKLVFESGGIGSAGANQNDTQWIRGIDAIKTGGVISVPKGWQIGTIYYYSAWTNASTFTFATSVYIGGDSATLDDSYSFARFTIGKLPLALNTTVSEFLDAINTMITNPEFSLVNELDVEIHGFNNDVTPSTWATSGYVDVNGTRQGDPDWNISNPIPLGAGQTIAVSTQGRGITVIALPAVDNYYEPLVKIPGDVSGQLDTYYYTAENDMSVVVSAETGLSGVEVRVSLKGIAPTLNELKQEFDTNSYASPSGAYSGTIGAYINSSGEYIEGIGSDYKATKDYIQVIPGYTIKFSTPAPFANFYGAFYDKNKSVISTFQANSVLIPDGALYVRISWYSGSITSGTYTYNATNSAELIFNTNKSTSALILGIQDELGRVGGGNNIVCWGDSLTQGAGADRLTNLSTVLSALSAMGFDVSGLSSGAPWPTVLQSLIGSSVAVDNNGIGGENLKDICCRIGVNPLVVNTGFTLPATAGTKVQVAVSALDFAWGGHPTFTFQASRYNPVFVDGIECSFTKHDGSSYDLTRVETATARDIKVGDTISFRGVTLRTPKAVVFFMGANGGYNNAADLVAKVRKAVSAVGTPNYLCLFNYAWDSASVTNTKEISAAMLSEFGSNFIDLQTYLSGHALADFGITPTTDGDLTPEQIANGVQSDVALMAAGALPSSLWRNCYGVDGATSNDKHLNAAGYAIVGYKIYERMKILNII